MNGKKIIQIVKTFDGALWAVQQVSELVRRGWEVHVFSPSMEGRYRSQWDKSGAILHQVETEFPVRSVWSLPWVAENLKARVEEIRPDLIHSHFVSTTLLMRWALKGTPIPRLFQVPGPLHLENSFFGQWETMSADDDDYWIASSEYIKQIYRLNYGIRSERLFMSYYGTDLSHFRSGIKGAFRQKYGIPLDAEVVANVSFIYPPKYYLGQTVGLKGHELMLESLRELLQENPQLYAVFIGSQWGVSQKYFEKLKSQARAISDRIIFTGYIPQNEIASAWGDFDLALHIPSSENCGGVIEPLLNHVPVVAAKVGGLTEIIIPGETGYLAEQRTSTDVKNAIKQALAERSERRKLAEKGKLLVERLFDVKRTSCEIENIYTKILQRTSSRICY